MQPDRRAAATAMFSAAVFCSLLGSCKDATQARMTVRTNVEYKPGVNLAIWGGRRSDGSGRPLSASAEPWLNDGVIGDLVVVPNENADEALSMRVVIGIGRDAAGCTDDNAKGCIVARRKLRFVPRVGLRVPVVLHLACEGVVCSADTTCNFLGKCVSAEIDPASCTTSEGCVLPGDETVTQVARTTEAGAPEADATSDIQTDASPEAETGPKKIEQLAAVGFGSCARFDTGDVKCWGYNLYGGLGLGDTQNRCDAPAEPIVDLPVVDLGSGRRALSVWPGYSHSCAIVESGQVKCWGRNNSGQLGIGDTQDRGDGANEMGSNLPPVDLGAGRTTAQLALGFTHTCAILDTGQVKCWGQNNSGQLGVGDTQSRGDGPNEMGAFLPSVDLGAGRTAKRIVAGSEFTCALLDDATVRCWGVNVYGMLGQGDTLARGDAPGELGAALPVVDFGPGRTVIDIDARYVHTCARLDNSQVKCWGFNEDGELGLGDRGNRGVIPGQMGANLPALDLGPGRTALSVAVGSFHGCAVLDDKTVKCWGRNDGGQLGLGDLQDRGYQPGAMGAALPSLDFGTTAGIAQLTVGDRHGYVLFDTGQAKCWGINGSGQLGLGDVVSRGDGPLEMGNSLPFLQLLKRP